MKYSTFKNFERLFSIKIKELIGSDFFLEALQELKKEAEGYIFVESDLSLMESRFNRVQKDFNRGFLSVSEKNIELTKLSRAFLDYIDELKIKYQVRSNNKSFIQASSLDTIKQIIKDKLGEKDLKTEQVIVVTPHDVDFWTSGVEPFDPVSDSSRYVAFWLLMKKSDKKFAVYTPDIFSIRSLANYLAKVVLPHMSELNYKWRLKKAKKGKEKKITGWLSLKVSAIEDGDQVYLSGKYSTPKSSPYPSGPKPGYPRQADPSMLTPRK